jgi:hypothetical protein
MRPEPDKKPLKPTTATRRADRLKVALKANMARRKAQAKARTVEDAAGRDEE